MQILLCSATSFEIQPTINWIEKEGLQQNIQVLITGVGLTAATYAITKNVLMKTFIAVQAGVAGSLSNSLQLGQCVVVENDAIGDLGVEENDAFKTIFQLGFENENSHPWQDSKLKNNFSNFLQLANLPLVDAVTVNEISTSEKRIDFYKKTFNASIESMEGAALHYVCLMENIPFIQLRAVSNFIGERDKTKWALQQAIENLNVELKRVIQKLIEL